MANKIAGVIGLFLLGVTVGGTIRSCSNPNVSFFMQSHRVEPNHSDESFWACRYVPVGGLSQKLECVDLRNFCESFTATAEEI